MTRPARCRRPLVLVTLVCFMAACHKWAPLDSPLEQTLAEHHGKVRITDDDGGRFVFHTTWVARDSVFGVTDGDTIPVALSAVAQAEQRKADVAGTAATVVLGVLGAVAAYLGIYLIVFCSSPDVHC